jgi:hypothetical protein
MKRQSAWQVAIVLVTVGCLPGCKGMWNDLFGGGSSSQQAATLTPGSLEECDPIRDPNLPTWLTTNHPCSSTAQCHTGSFCTGSGTAGVCMRECGDGLPACTGNRYCSCQGLCEEITPEVGNDAGSTGGAACERNVVRLMAIKKSDPATRARCESDEFCPNGAYCDQSTGFCSWDCLDELNCQGDNCCASGLICTCSGRCENPDAGATVVRRKFDVEVSPSVVRVVPGTGNADWQRSFDVILRTRDESMLAGTGTSRSVQTAVAVRPGTSLKVACNPSGTPIWAPGGCVLGGTSSDAWEFSLTGESWWTASKTVYLSPSGVTSTDAGVSDPNSTGNALSIGDDWAVRISGEVIAPAISILSVDVTEAKADNLWVTPVFDFGSESGQPKGYKGNALIRTPLGLAVRSIPGVDHEINVALL